MSQSRLFAPSRAELLDEALAIYTHARAAHQVSETWVCFSGGDDSLTVAEWASRQPSFSGCVHINTGIGVEETRQHVRETCARRGWPLVELHPPARQYEDLVLEYGFPGPGAHLFMYSWLKERALRQFVEQRKRVVAVCPDCNEEQGAWTEGQTRRCQHCPARGRKLPSRLRQYTYRVGLVTGVRRDESVRRMGTTRPVQQDGSRVWIAPLISWSKVDCLAYLAETGAERSPVSRLLGMSGECLCGAFAEPGELDRLEQHFPATADRILDLQERARTAGVPCRWGQAPPRPVKLPEVPDCQMTLCSTCEFKAWLQEQKAAGGYAE